MVIAGRGIGGLRRNGHRSPQQSPADRFTGRPGGPYEYPDAVSPSPAYSQPGCNAGGRYSIPAYSQRSSNTGGRYSISAYSQPGCNAYGRYSIPIHTDSTTHQGPPFHSRGH